MFGKIFQKCVLQKCIFQLKGFPRFGTATLSCSCKTHKCVFSKQKYYHWWVSLFPKLPIGFFFLLLYAAVLRQRLKKKKKKKKTCSSLAMSSCWICIRKNLQTLERQLSSFIDLMASFWQARIYKLNHVRIFREF